MQTRINGMMVALSLADGACYQLIIGQSMGNICCEEDQNQNRNRRQIVPTNYRNVAQYQRSRTQQEQQVQMQKTLLRDFSTAVIRLKKSAAERPNRIYKGVYTHASISSDEISEYFAATLVGENDDFKPCVVKKVTKERLKNQYLKRNLSIQYLMTSYHHSNFIVKNLYFYQDYTYLCLYFDLAHFFHLNIFTYNPQYDTYFRSNLENHIRFIIAGIILALEELHSLQVVYRGINNQNIVITENGYPLITNLANLHPEGHTAPVVVSSPFVSPQEFKNQPVTRAADFWALGVLTFHMITRNFPNLATFQEGQFNPFGISPQLSDLVNRLICFDPQQRLGMRSLNDLKAHAFFYGFDWYRYANHQLQSPFSDRSSCPKRALPEEQYDYHQKENFDYSYGGGMMGGMMAGMLFMDLAGLLMISTLFERDYLYDEHALPNEEVLPAQLPSNEFQEGAAFELSDDSNGSPQDAGIGGDYD